MSTCTIHGYVFSRCGMCVEIEAKELKRERDEALAKIERLTKRETALEDENEKYNKHFIEEMDDNARLRKERDEAWAVALTKKQEAEKAERELTQCREDWSRQLNLEDELSEALADAQAWRRLALDARKAIEDALWQLPTREPNPMGAAEILHDALEVKE